jgi:hypothetical protein
MAQPTCENIIETKFEICFAKANIDLLLSLGFKKHPATHDNESCKGCDICRRAQFMCFYLPEGWTEEFDFDYDDITRIVKDDQERVRFITFDSSLERRTMINDY